MNKYNTIKITMANGQVVCWDAGKDEWDDYAYDGTAFIVKKDGEWVGIYNINYVISIIVR